MSEFVRSLCRIAIPVTLQSMLQASFSIIDQIMIGQLGETNISAVGLCGNYSLIFSVLIGAVSTVAGILIAQFIGAEDGKEAWCSFWVSLIVGIWIASVFLTASGFLSSEILGFYTKDSDIINAGAVYFQIVAFTYIPMAVSNILSAWLHTISGKSWSRGSKYRAELCLDIWKGWICSYGNQRCSDSNPRLTVVQYAFYFYRICYQYKKG